MRRKEVAGKQRAKGTERVDTLHGCRIHPPKATDTESLRRFFNLRHRSIVRSRERAESNADRDTPNADSIAVFRQRLLFLRTRLVKISQHPSFLRRRCVHQKEADIIARLLERSSRSFVAEHSQGASANASERIMIFCNFKRDCVSPFPFPDDVPADPTLRIRSLIPRARTACE